VERERGEIYEERHTDWRWMERDRRKQIERKRQRGEAQGKRQRGRDREERYRRRDIKEMEGQRQKGTH
jgi:uncharacterized protein YaiI (UPF0178 family)